MPVAIKNPPIRDCSPFCYRRFKYISYGKEWRSLNKEKIRSYYLKDRDKAILRSKNFRIKKLKEDPYLRSRESCKRKYGLLHEAAFLMIRLEKELRKNKCSV